MARPPKYATPRAMQRKINSYFASLRETRPMLDAEGRAVTDRRGNPVYLPGDTATVSGLALHLGFSSRQSLINYAQKDAEFKEILDLARLRIETSQAELLFNRDTFQGAKFSLSVNFGWREITETVNKNIDIPASEEEAEKHLAALGYIKADDEN